MVATQKSLLSLTAADLMSRSLVLVPREMSLRGAARLLSRAQVSGAPVVDAEGRCIGVISATDFLNSANSERPARPNSEACVCSSWQIVDEEKIPECQIENYMTHDPVTTSPRARIVDLVRTMIDAHIHRVIVVDEKRRPIGVVSSTDILGAVARAA